MSLTTKIIGVMRFSVLTPTYFSERFDSLAAIEAHIYARERMALRFHLFEHLVLPSLLAQTDSDFDLVVLTGEAMPDEYKARLSALLEEVPNFHLMIKGAENHYQLLKQAYDSVATDGVTHLIKFRLDDDDAVDMNFISRLRSIGAGLHAMQPPDVAQVIAFNRGFYVKIDEGENEVFDACERAPLSVGTAVLAPIEDHRNPYRYNHRKLAQHYNTYSDISVPAFIRTIHGYNKSTPSQAGATHKMRPKVMNEQLQSHFGVNVDYLRLL